MICENCSYTGPTKMYKTGKDKYSRLCEDCADGWGFQEWDDAEDEEYDFTTAVAELRKYILFKPHLNVNDLEIQTQTTKENNK